MLHLGCSSDHMAGGWTTMQGRLGWVSRGWSETDGNYRFLFLCSKMRSVSLRLLYTLKARTVPQGGHSAGKSRSRIIR